MGLGGEEGERFAKFANRNQIKLVPRMVSNISLVVSEATFVSWSHFPGLPLETVRTRIIENRAFGPVPDRIQSVNDPHRVLRECQGHPATGTLHRHFGSGEAEAKECLVVSICSHGSVSVTSHGGRQKSDGSQGAGQTATV